MNKFITKKTVISVVMSLALSLLFALPCFATTDQLMGVVNPVVDLINSLLTPVLAIVGAAGTIYCVILGVKYARAEEPQDREKAKQHLKNAIIGFVLIFVLIVILKGLMKVMPAWVDKTVK